MWPKGCVHLTITPIQRHPVHLCAFNFGATSKDLYMNAFSYLYPKRTGNQDQILSNKNRVPVD